MRLTTLPKVKGVFSHFNFINFDDKFINFDDKFINFDDKRYIFQSIIYRTTEKIFT